MLSTFIQTAAKKCKTKLLVLVRCFPQFGHSTQVQRHTTHILSVRCAPWATAQQQPTTKSHGPSKNGCMFLALNRSPFCRLGHWSHFYPLLGSICHFLLPFWLLDAHIGGPARSDTLFFGGGPATEGSAWTCHEMVGLISLFPWKTNTFALDRASWVRWLWVKTLVS
jgi:hypothetical protein